MPLACLRLALATVAPFLDCDFEAVFDFDLDADFFFLGAYTAPPNPPVATDWPTIECCLAADELMKLGLDDRFWVEWCVAKIGETLRRIKELLL